MDASSAKRLAAETALERLPSSGTIGLGSGSTAKLFIEAVGRLVAQGRKLVGVPTSEGSAALARSLNIPLLDNEGPWDIAVCVDGADEVSERLDLIKGGGGCHTREKIVNANSRFNIIVVDDSKLSQRLGERWPIPVEVLAFGHHSTRDRLSRFGRVALREKNGAPWITDAGNFIYDVHAGTVEDPKTLDAELSTEPGVVATGLFVARADEVIIAGPDGVRSMLKTAG